MRFRVPLALLVLGCHTPQFADDPDRTAVVHFDDELAKPTIHVTARSRAPRDDKIDIDVFHAGERVVGGIGTQEGELIDPDDPWVAFVVLAGIARLPKRARFDIVIRYLTIDDHENAVRRWSVTGP